MKSNQTILRPSNREPHQLAPLDTEKDMAFPVSDYLPGSKVRAVGPKETLGGVSKTGREKIKQRRVGQSRAGARMVRTTAKSLATGQSVTSKGGKNPLFGRGPGRTGDSSSSYAQVMGSRPGGQLSSVPITHLTTRQASLRTQQFQESVQHAIPHRDLKTSLQCGAETVSIQDAARMITDEHVLGTGAYLIGASAERMSDLDARAAPQFHVDIQAKPLGNESIEEEMVLRTQPDSPRIPRKRGKKVETGSRRTLNYTAQRLPVSIGPSLLTSQQFSSSLKPLDESFLPGHSRFKTSVLFSRAHDQKVVGPGRNLQLHRKTSSSVFNAETQKQLGLRSAHQMLHRTKKMISENAWQIKIDKSKLLMDNLSCEKRQRAVADKFMKNKQALAREALDAGVGRQQRMSQESSAVPFLRLGLSHMNSATPSRAEGSIKLTAAESRQLGYSQGVGQTRNAPNLNALNQCSGAALVQNSSLKDGLEKSRKVRPKSSGHRRAPGLALQARPGHSQLISGLKHRSAAGSSEKLREQLMLFSSQLEQELSQKDLLLMHQHISLKKGAEGANLDNLRALYQKPPLAGLACLSVPPLEASSPTNIRLIMNTGLPRGSPTDSYLRNPKNLQELTGDHDADYTSARPQQLEPRSYQDWSSEPVTGRGGPETGAGLMFMNLEVNELLNFQSQQNLSQMYQVPGGHTDSGPSTHAQNVHARHTQWRAAPLAQSSGGFVARPGALQGSGDITMQEFQPTMTRVATRPRSSKLSTQWTFASKSKSCRLQDMAQNEQLQVLKEAQNRFLERIRVDGQEADSLRNLNTTAQIVRAVTGYRVPSQLEVNQTGEVREGEWYEPEVLEAPQVNDYIENLRTDKLKFEQPFIAVRSAQISASGSIASEEINTDARLKLPERKRKRYRRSRVYRRILKVPEQEPQLEQGPNSQSRRPRTPGLGPKPVKAVHQHSSQRLSPVPGASPRLAYRQGSIVPDQIDMFSQSQGRSTSRAETSKGKRRSDSAYIGGRPRKDVQAVPLQPPLCMPEVLFPADPDYAPGLAKDLRPPSYKFQLMFNAASDLEIQSQMMKDRSQSSHLSPQPGPSGRESPNVASKKEAQRDQMPKTGKRSTMAETQGEYYVLKPTLSLDSGPNHKEKVYNGIQLRYNPENHEKKLSSQALCIVEIPIIYEHTQNQRKRGETKGQDDGSESKERRKVPLALTQDQGPDYEEWSIPIKFIIKQRDVNIGQDFKQPRIVDFYVSQNTKQPDEQNHEMHCRARFNVKSRNNYDKEFGVNQVFQFVFKKDQISKQLALEKNPGLAAREEPASVRYPNQVFVTIQCNRDCLLDIVAQLSLQPEPLDEQQRRLKDLQKRRENMDQEQVVAIENDLRAYFTRNEAFFNEMHNISETNFVKENARSAEHYESLEERQYLYAAHNFATRLKQFRAKAIVENEDADSRERVQNYIARWDGYRAQRELLIEKAIKIVKEQRRSKVLISFVLQSRVLAIIKAAVRRRLDFYNRKFHEILIAIKFKAKYTVTFKKLFGHEFSHRQVNAVRRNLTFLALLQQGTSQRQAQKAFHFFFQKIKFFAEFARLTKRYIRAAKTVQEGMCTVRKESATRIRVLRELYKGEHDFLMWYYQKQLAGIRNQNSKAYRDTQHTLRRFRGSSEEGQGASREREVLEAFAGLCRAIYMLDYTIWQVLRLRAASESLKQRLDEQQEPNTSQVRELEVIQSLQRYSLRRLKDWRVQIVRFEADTFDGTTFVDTEQLVILSREGFHLEQHGEEAKNDDLYDLSVLQGGANAKSRKPSPKKKKKSKKSEVIEKQEQTSFLKQQSQAMMVDLLLKLSTEPLDASDSEKLDELTVPFVQMGDKFPPYRLLETRENIQRLVVKACGVEE